MSAPSLRRLAALLLVALASPVSAPSQDDPLALLDRLQAAWSAHALEDYLDLWRFASPEARESEAQFARDNFAAADTRLLFERTASVPAADRLGYVVRTFAATEPRARVEQWTLRLERTEAGWRVTQREPRGRIDGLVHLPLDPDGFLAEGHVLRLPDFELRFRRGTLYATASSLGPTALVFVGEGLLRFTPHPGAEREQLRQFWGQPELVEKVGRAFVRLHPADLGRVLEPAELKPDPHAGARLHEARRFFDEQAGTAFVLDTDLPGSPWWALPSPGDALVAFTSRRGVLSYTLSGSQAESINLFDRTRRLQVCLYARDGGTSYSEDDQRDAEALHHDLNVSFDPQRRTLRGEDTLRLRLLKPVASVRLRLNAALKVRSVTSAEDAHMFFRVRHQDSVVVPLGPLGTGREFELKVSYEGELDPGQLLDEVQVPGRDARYSFSDNARLEEVSIYSNRALWYPHPASDDYATAQLQLAVPSGYVAVSGGLRAAALSGDGRWSATWVQEQPAKYLAAVVGRLFPAGERAATAVRLQGYASARRRGDVDSVLKQAAQILDFFSARFGPCPYPNLNVALIEGFAPGGHSPPGLVVLTERDPLLKSLLRDDPASFDDVPGFFLAHELAHQWWGQGVAGRNYHERWLSEGVAQYAAALWTRRTHGERVFQEVLQRFERWALRKGSEGPISLGYRLGHIKQDPQIYRAVVYDKGAYVLHMLHEIVGEEAFLKALQDYQQRYRFGKAGTDDLREALERVSGQALGPYFDAWVSGTRVPRLRYSWKSHRAGEGWTTRVEVSAFDLPGPVPLEIVVSYGGGQVLKRVTLLPEGGAWSFPSPARARRVGINGDRALLAQVTSD